MKFRIKWLAALVTAVLSCCTLTACGGDDDDEPDNSGDISLVVGCWKGSSDSQPEWTQYVQIRGDYTATIWIAYTEELPKYRTIYQGTLIWDYDGTKWDFVEENNYSFAEYDLWYLPGQNLLKFSDNLYLHRCLASEIPTEPANSGGNSGGGNSSSGGNSGNSNNNQGESQSNNLKILLNHRTWSWNRGTFDNGFFTFYDSNKIQFLTVGKSTVGSVGVPTLSAQGTFTVIGNTLTATYTDVSVDPSLTSVQMSSHFPGWSVGSTKTVRYTIKSIDDSGLTLTDGSQTWYLDPLF